MIKLTIADVRRIGQPSTVLGRRNAEHWASRLYARRLSPYVTLAAYRLGLRANTLTGVMVVVGIAGAGVMALGGVLSAVFGVVLIQIYLVLDCSDGELARVEGSTSAKGVFLDRIGHYFVEAILVTALGVRLSGPSGGFWLTLALATALGATLIKIQGDLIDTSRYRMAMRALEDTAYETTNCAAGGLRRALSILPLHRVFGAVELSLLILFVALIDSAATPDLPAQGILLLVLAGAAAVSIPGRLWVILNSDRLDP